MSVLATQHSYCTPLVEFRVMNKNYYLKVPKICIKIKLYNFNFKFILFFYEKKMVPFDFVE